GVVLSLFNIYIAIWICICMVICCVLAFVIFGIGCVIAKKKPEKLFGFAVAQLIFLAINHSFNIAQLGLNAIFVFVEILFLGKFLFGGEGLWVELAYAGIVAGINLLGGCCYFIASVIVSIIFAKCIIMFFKDRPKGSKENNSIEKMDVSA
ncbi:MAG: hypothetical protein IKY53_06320, partial [Lachnospiraceae bacterium]|nr:hypothetical protein [Lachnospiraceae bacterium]